MLDSETTGLFRELDALASAVGFSSVALPSDADCHSLPAESQLWESSYAVLALVPVQEVVLEALAAAEAVGTAWFLERLHTEQQHGRFLDGYLVLALRAKPLETLRAAIQDIAVRTDTCRRHVIWPDAEGKWERQVWDVPVLGLPPVRDVVASAQAEFELPLAAEEALTLYARTKSYQETAEQLQAKAVRTAHR